MPDLGTSRTWQMPGFEIEAVYVEEIPIEPGRKHRPIVLLP